MTLEQSALLRTIETNRQDLDLREKSNKTHENGLKKDSCLNSLKYFNVTKGLPPDIMHDLLEGVIRYNFCCLIEYLNEKHLYSAKQLNNDLKLFKYGRIDKDNKLPIDLFTDKSSYKLSATHMWTLLRVFPVLVGEQMKNLAHFTHFVKLAELFRKLYDLEYYESKIKTIEIEINVYLENFKLLYPAKKIIPKQHFLIHYPSAIRNFGPPRTLSCIRFEAKHSYFKRVISSIHNRRNLYKSLATRHQLLQAYHLVSPIYFVDIEYGSMLNDKNFIDLIQIKLRSKQFDVFKSITKNGINYEINDLIVTNIHNNMPIFSMINAIILFKNNIIFLSTQLDTVEYVSHKSCYKLKQIESAPNLYESSKLANLWPLDLYEINDELIVIPKYPLV